MSESQVISLEGLTFNPQALDPELFTKAAIEQMKGATIWKGPFQGGGLSGPELQDPRALAMTELRRAQLLFSTGLQGRETAIAGNIRWGRLHLICETGLVLAGAKQFLGLWMDYKRNGSHSMLECIASYDNVHSFDFLGTVLRGPDGKPYTLELVQRDPHHGWFTFWRDATEIMKLHALLLHPGA